MIFSARSIAAYQIHFTVELDSTTVELILPDWEAGDPLDFHVYSPLYTEFPEGFNYKIYRMPEADCAGVPENTHRPFPYDPGTRYFILLANATEETVLWTIGIE